MGELADALRSNLRQLAQADARLLRELDDALPADGLDGLTLKQLKDRCKQLGLKGTSNLKKAELIQRLRAAGSAVGGRPARSLPLAKMAPATTPSPTTSSELAAVQARLDRLEALLVRIAGHLGVEA
jgi:hypothetical protein